jgi:competence protein ComEC
VKRRADPPDLRLLPPVAAGWAATWLGLSLPPAPTLVAAGGLALCGFYGMAQARRRAADHPLGVEPLAVTACTTLLVAAGLALSAALHVAAGSHGPVPGLAAQSAIVGTALTVTGDPRRIAPTTGPSKSGEPPRPARRLILIMVPVRITDVTTSDGTHYAVGDSATVMARIHAPADEQIWLGLLPSQHLLVTGKLVPPRDAGRDAALLIADRAPQVTGGPSLIQGAAGRLRADLREAASGLPAEEAGVLPALAVGDTSHEPPDLADALKRTGLTYLTVVSGENLVFASAALIPLARWVGLRGRAVTGAGFLLVVGFTVLARPGPPMVRATVMSLLNCAAALSGRRFRALSTMAAAVLVLLLIDPWLALTYGFALSVAATAGLLIAAPGWCDRLLDRGVPLWIAGPAATTAAAEVFCEPLLVTFSGSLPLIAVPANVLAVPAAPVATVLGIGAMAADEVWPPFGHAVAWIAQWPVRWICLVARTWARMPGASVAWPSGLGGCFALLAAYVGAYALIRRGRRAKPSHINHRVSCDQIGLDKTGVGSV